MVVKSGKLSKVLVSVVGVLLCRRGTFKALTDSKLKDVKSCPRVN